MPDIFLRQGAANPSDIILRDPTTSGSASYTLTALVATMALSAQSATASKTLTLTAAVGTLTLTAQSAVMGKAYTLAAASASLALSAQSASEARGIALPASAAALMLSAKDATLTVTSGSVAYTLTAASAALLLSGKNAFATVIPFPIQRPQQLVGFGGGYYPLSELLRQRKRKLKEQEPKPAERPAPRKREPDPVFVKSMTSLGTRSRRTVTFTPMNLSQIERAVRDQETAAARATVRRRREREVVEV